jgi:hypothetical protein
MTQLRGLWRSVSGLSLRGGMATGLLLALVAIGEAAPLALRDDVTDGRTYRVTTKVVVTGEVKTQKTGGQVDTRKLNVEAGFQFDERRLPGTGRGEKAYRAVRWIESARSEIRNGEQVSFGTLRPVAQLIVAQGESNGVDAFSPSAPLTPLERNLLRFPGDPLMAQALLPETDVEVRETWKPAAWVIQTMTNVDATQKGSLVCTLESLVDNVATVTFNGELEGATDGADTKLTFNGRMEFDAEKKVVRLFELVQKEKRGIGAISPGLDVEARVDWKRDVVTEAPRFDDAALEKLSLDANEANQLLQSDLSQWGLKLYHDRRWTPFHQTPQTAILRMLHEGNFIAQVNIVPLPKPADGKPQLLAKFEGEVKAALGAGFKEIVQSSEFKTAAGLSALRVCAAGESKSVAMEWHYYLVSAPTGEQVVLVFVVEPEFLELLGSSDLKIVETLELSPVKAPQPAAAGNPKGTSR